MRNERRWSPAIGRRLSASLVCLMVLGASMPLAASADDGARLLQDIQAGRNGSAWGSTTVVGDLVFFVAVERGADVSRFRWDTPDKDWPVRFGLWATDGTKRGTRRVDDLSASYYDDLGGFVEYLGDDEGALLYERRLAPDDPRCGTGAPGTCPLNFVLWRSDGTMEGTAPLLDEAGRPTGIDSPLIPAVGGYYYAGFDLDQGHALFRVDSGSTEARLVRAFAQKRKPQWERPVPLAELGGRLVFLLGDRVHGNELWAMDGTGGKPVLLADIAPGAASLTRDPGPGSTVVIRGRLFFQARQTDDDPGFGTWVTDGTQAGTHRLTDALLTFESVGPDLPLVLPGDDEGHGAELWSADGTPAGTVRLLDIAPGPADGFKRWLGGPTDDGIRFFVGDDGLHGPEPWVTDGTSEGTRLFADIDPSPGAGSDPSLGMPVGERLFLVADGSGAPGQAWVTDGTSAGTQRVDTDGGRVIGLWPDPLVTAFDGDVVFATRDRGARMSIWRTDGSATGTRRIWQGRAGQLGLAPIDDVLWFTAWTDRSGSLWRSDGTKRGTQVVTDGTGRRLDVLGSVSRTRDGIVFMADDGTHGYEPFAVGKP